MPREIKTDSRSGQAETQRLADHNAGKEKWHLWGPYISERQWGMEREDYSPDGTAWDYFPHDHARSRAYRWGEDRIAGISDDNPFAKRQRTACPTAKCPANRKISRPDFRAAAGPD
jgi:hypothetical protein